jgi:predicted permease
MRWLLQLRWRSKTLLRRSRAEAALSDEMRFHLEQQIAENQEAGMAPEEARHAALRTFGGITTFQEECRDMHRANLIENFWQDLRYSLRTLGKTPLFATVVVLTLALGIGANTAIFSVMNAVILRLLPVRDPARLVYLATTSSGDQSGDGDTSITEYMFEQLRAQKQIFSDVVAFAPLDFVKVAVRYGPVPEEAYVDMVSGDYFSGLGVHASRGQILNMDDEQRHTAMAVLCFDYWTRRFASDPAVIGQTLYVRGIPFTIEGIAAPGFAGVGFSRATDIWIPLQTRADLKPWGVAPDDPESIYGAAQTWWCLKAMARLAAGITEKQALSQAGPIFERAAWAGTQGQRPGDTPRHIVLEPGRGIEGLRSRLDEPLKALMAMVGLVLVIACGNIAMLLAARNRARVREFSLRMALGGSLGRLFRQLLTENLLLVAAGSILGWIFVAWVAQALAAWLRVGLSLAPDRSVLFFTAGISIAVALMFGLSAHAQHRENFVGPGHENIGCHRES